MMDSKGNNSSFGPCTQIRYRIAYKYCRDIRTHAKQDWRRATQYWKDRDVRKLCSLQMDAQVMVED